MELPESMAKEVAKQDALLKKRKAEAYLEGTLLAQEVAQGVKDEAAKRLKVHSANDKTRARQYTAIMSRLSFRKLPQSVIWALGNLPSPAYIADRTVSQAATKLKLREAAVTACTEDCV